MPGQIPIISPTVGAADPRTPSARPVVIVPPDAGVVRHAFGESVQLKVGGAENGGALAVGLHTLPSGARPPHRCLGDDAVCVVADGRIELQVGDAWVATEPGAVVFLPRGVCHGFRNAGDAPSRHWMLTAPSGFELFFQACADTCEDAAVTGTAPDRARILALAAEYRVELGH